MENLNKEYKNRGDIQFVIDDILVKEWGTGGFMSYITEQKLEKELIKRGYDPSDAYQAVRHYKNL